MRTLIVSLIIFSSVAITSLWGVFFSQRKAIKNLEGEIEKKDKYIESLVGRNEKNTQTIQTQEKEIRTLKRVIASLQSTFTTRL